MKMWKAVPITEYQELYQVSSEGDVYSKRSGRCLKPKLSHTGYYRVTLSKNGEAKTYGIHRLVALAFIENPSSKPTVNHINEIKTDNRVKNLEWATTAEQNIHGTRIKRAMKHTDWEKRSEKIDYIRIAEKHDYSRNDMCNRKPVLVYRNGEFVGQFESHRKAAAYTGASTSKISQCVSGQRKTSKGYVFKEASICESETE